MDNVSVRSGTNSIVREITGAEYRSDYVSLNFNEALDIEEVIEVYTNAIHDLVKRDYKIVYEKCFGKQLAKDKYCEVRRELFELLNIDLPPISYIEGEPLFNRIATSATLFAVKSESTDLQVNYISDNEGKVVGTCYLDRMYLLGVESDQYDEVFHQIDALLQKAGRMDSHTLIRTWIYLKHINEDYALLNKARKRYFQRNEIGYSELCDYLPASTCIGGTASDSPTVAVDAVFMKNAKVKRIYTSNLNEAEGENYLFKPTFSRALLIEDNSFLEIQLSGTASVNEKGESVFVGDPYKQINRALDNIESIIGQYGFTYENFVQSTCFFKNGDYYEAFCEIIKEREIDTFTVTFVEESVCRDDLLFELDGVLIKKKG